MTPIGPRIYNLFPRLVGHTREWIPHVRRAAEMRFTHIFINPFHYSGFSGSLYAPKDYYRLNPLFVPPDESEHDLGLLAEVTGEIRDLGMVPMMDLVINHTASDCPLVKEHPGWYKRTATGELLHPTAMDPADARNVTVWGDLAEINNEAAVDRKGLWQYWKDLVSRYIELGFGAFRADAAYKVPATLWTELIAHARSLDPDVTFVAEALGCRLSEIEALQGTGFDYLYNSSKWWDYQEPWCLEQYELFREIAPSVSFPESHDTDRLAAETNGDKLALKRAYTFAALFSASVQTTVGFEYGFARKPDVVHTGPQDWEQPQLDISDFIARVNELKNDQPVFNEDAPTDQFEPPNGNVLVLRKRGSTGQEALLLLNKTHQPQKLQLETLRGLIGGGEREIVDVSPEDPLDYTPEPFACTLAPAEVRVFVTE